MLGPESGKLQTEVDFLKLQDFPAQLAMQKQDLSDTEKQTKDFQENVDKRLDQISSAKAELTLVREIHSASTRSVRQ